MTANKVVLWILHISHKNFDSYWVFDSEDGAKERVTRWAEEWWEKDGPDRPRPESDAEMILEYFPFAEEHWTIEQTELNQP